MYTGWPQSELRISAVMCLNEIVNAAEKFVSRYPHLVVDQLDWIQTRYLFVECLHETGAMSEEPNPLLGFLPQDPFYFVHGDNGSCLGIPISAVRTSNRFRLSQRGTANPSKTNNKRRRLSDKGGLTEFDFFADDDASVDTDIEDIELLLSDDDERTPGAPNSKGKSKPTARTVDSLLHALGLSEYATSKQHQTPSSGSST
jgi:ubiquitin-conjugating enzyme E2 Q